MERRPSGRRGLARVSGPGGNTKGNGLRYFLSLALLLACARAFAEDDERLRQLVAQLSAEDVSARDAAQSELERLGAADDTGAVERLLADAAKSADPEVSSRARAALRSVRYWERIVVFGGKESVQAFDLPSGEPQWKRQSPFPALQKPWSLFAHTQAWVSPRQRGVTAILQWFKQGLEAVDLWTGERRWCIEGCESGRQISKDRYLGVDDKHLLWISLPDGAVLWKQELPQLFLGIEECPLAYDGETLVLGTKEGSLAIQTATGVDRWTIPGSALTIFEAGPGQMFAVVYHDHAPTVVERLDPGTGKSLWECAAPVDSYARVIPDPAGAAHALIVNVYRKDDYTGTMRVLDVETGKVLSEGERAAYAAEFEPGGEVAWIGGPVNNCCLQDHYTQGSLRAVKLATGEVLARFETGSTATEFVRTDAVLFAVTYPPGGFGFHSYVTRAGSGLELRAIDLKTRKLIWSSAPDGVGGESSELYNPVHLSMAGGSLLLEGETSSSGCSAELFDPATGKVTARHVVPAK